MHADPKTLSWQLRELHSGSLSILVPRELGSQARERPSSQAAWNSQGIYLFFSWGCYDKSPETGWFKK